MTGLTIIAVFSEGISLLLFVPVLRKLIPAETLKDQTGEPEAIQNPFDFLSNSLPDNLSFLFSPENILISLLSLILLLMTAKTALNLINNWLTASCQWELMANWSKRLLKIYIEKDYLSFLNHKHGKMLGNIILETRVAAIGVREAIASFSQLILSIAYVGVLFYTNWQITLFQLAAIFALAVAAWGFVHRRTTRISRASLEAKQQAEASASESLSALRQIKAAATESEVVSKFGKSVDEMALLMTKQTAYAIMPKPVSELLVLVLVISTVYYLYIFTDLLIASQIPMIALVILIANRLFVSLGKLANSYMTFTAALPAMELIAKQLDQELHEKDPALSGITSVDLTKDIVFSNIRFRYPGKSKNVLDGLNLRIRGGKVTALVGSSGGGKSTIIDLLLGFIVPDEGILSVDGMDHKDLDYSVIRKKIAYVSQEAFMFNCSIRDNLLMHNSNATDLQIKDACQKANIGRFIEGLPEKYDTLVGERGVKLSGGERQRLAIAIALLREAELIIFDEPTSALDSETEHAVHEAVRELKNQTIFFVTHRVSSALNPDHVYRLSKGKAKEIEVGEVSGAI